MPELGIPDGVRYSGGQLVVRGVEAVRQAAEVGVGQAAEAEVVRAVETERATEEEVTAGNVEARL